MNFVEMLKSYSCRFRKSSHSWQGSRTFSKSYSARFTHLISPPWLDF